MDSVFGYDTSLVVSIVALIIGIIILIAPKFLNYLVAIYLIVIGVIGLWPHISNSTATTTDTSTTTTTTTP
jgi:hypothetical protein